MAVLILQMVATITVAIVMGLSLAHALELPGKLRLTREQYLAVQTIYYPGFTLGGAAEPISVLLLMVLAFFIRIQHAQQFWLVIAALVGIVAAQLVFWTMTQPVNRYWLQQTQTSAAARRFFGSVNPDGGAPEWTTLRDRWERSHLLRALAASVAFVLLVIALGLGNNSG